MINYSTWLSKQVRVTDTNLDPENPRIPPTPSTLAQLELIHLFCRHYEVHSLAKSIVEDGYFPDERIVVIEQDGLYVVLEGNRRIAALKVLMNPDLAPDEMKSKFQRLAESVDRKLIEQCDALVSPSRSAATKLILEKHTQQSVLTWSPLMKAEFYRKMTDQGISASEISRQYNLTASTVQGFLRMSRMYRLALTVELPSNVKDLVLDPQEFPISTLERVCEAADARKILTLSDDLSTISCPPSDFKKAFSQIVSDVATGAQDSRTLDTASDIRDYAIKIAENAGIKETGVQVKVDTIFPQHHPSPILLAKKTTPKTTRGQKRGRFYLISIINIEKIVPSPLAI